MSLRAGKTRPRAARPRREAAPRAQKDARRFLRLRLWVVAGLFVAGFAVLVLRAGVLQVWDHHDLQARAQREFIRQVEVAPRRGVIYDRNQEELAVSLDTDSVYASPLKITTPVRTGRALARALGLPAREVIRRLRGERGFVWVARRISPDKAARVRSLGLAGVGLLKEPRRFYPNRSLACHVLGFAGLDARGLEGLERQYDKVLRGSSHTVTSLRDALGRTIHLNPAAFTSLPEGNHLILTLDKAVQYRAEKVLAATVERYHAKGGQVVVLVPQTGEILAMASNPAFNPNVFGRQPRGTWRNRCLTDTFEPGSTFKVFVAAAALMSSRVGLDTIFDCEEGHWLVGGRTIHDAHPHGDLNLADIVKFSSNIGAAKVGMAIGPRALYHAIRAFGFGQPTDVDLPGESRGILRPVSSWRPVDLANICFGQGVAVTPLQLACAVGAVANGGVLMRPFVVRAQVDQDSQLVRETQPRVVRRVMSPRDARLLTEMMVRVTEPGGTGTRARMEPYQVAGKTGTAQKVNEGGGYSHTDFIASFVGFVPADNPKVVVLVMIDTPRGSHYGGVVAGPAFARIAKEALTALGVGQPPAPLVMAQAQAKDQAPAAPPAPPRSAEDPAKALAAGLIPDLRGLTMRQVLALARHPGLMVRPSGWGRVVSQDPAPGLPLKGPVAVRLSPPAGGA